MNESRRIRLFAVAFVLLAALNIATLAAFFLFRKQGPPAGPKGGTVDFLVNELQLDSSQKQQLLVLVQEHRAQMRSVHEGNREAKDAFFNLLANAGISDSALAAAAREASLPGQQGDIYTFRHFQKVRALCNETQRRQFDAIIHEVLRMNAPPPGGGPPPHGERPPGGGPPPNDERRPGAGPPQ